MSALKIAALQRKRRAAEKAGNTARVESIDARIAALENPVAAAEKKQVEADAWDGLNMTAAARAHADALKLKPGDFKGWTKSGKGGFLVSDVDAIAGARDKAGSEGGTDGDD